MKKIKYLTILGLTVFIFHGCYYDNEELLYRFSNSICDTTSVTFNGYINSILANNCIACHSGASASGNPQVNLDSYNGVKIVASNGRMLNAVSYITKPMPPGGKMDYCNIAKIRIWVNSGAPNN